MMADPTLGILRPTDPAKVLAKAAEKLYVPAGSIVRDGMVQLPPGATPADVFHPAPTVPVRSDDSEAYRYLRRVFEHCAPQCTPLPDLLGLCTQVDNLIVGYRIDLGLMPDPAKSGVPVPPSDEARVERVARALAANPFFGDYEEVPVEEVFQRQRYLHLKQRYERQARAVIAAYEAP